MSVFVSLAAALLLFPLAGEKKSSSLERRSLCSSSSDEPRFDTVRLRRDKLLACFRAGRGLRAGCWHLLAVAVGLAAASAPSSLCSLFVVLPLLSFSSLSAHLSPSFAGLGVSVGVAISPSVLAVFSSRCWCVAVLCTSSLRVPVHVFLRCPARPQVRQTTWPVQSAAMWPRLRQFRHFFSSLTPRCSLW